MVLLRRLLGDVLRERRREQGRTLREVSASARASLGYLSEVERGQKEASSELLSSLCSALEVPLSDVLREVQGTSTWESLAASARILRDQAMTDVVLVPDGYHALRVHAIADELGLDASVSPSGNRGSVRDYAEETAAVAVGLGLRRVADR